MEKFRDKYRIDSARLPGWDYSSPGYYYVTICIAGRMLQFGNVIRDKMKFNQCGQLADSIWKMIPEYFQSVSLGPYVVMPNHIHGIIVIEPVDDSMIPPDVGDSVETRLIASLQNPQQPGGITGQFNPMLHKNLSRIIRWYKGRVTFECRKIDPSFQWQPRFYHRIIRNEDELNNASHYIQNNPAQWNRDRFYQPKG